MGGHRGGGDDKDQPGHGIFAYRTKDDKTWRLHMTMSSALRTTLEGYSAREWIIMPLVLLSIAGMGILYSLLPDDMTARVIPAEVLEIYESPRMEFELGELKEADAVIKAANEGFIMTGRLKMTSYLRKLEPLADALEHSRTKLAEKEAMQEQKLANRKVVKNPGVPKPDDWKPYVPPAPKEKKLKRKEYRTAQNGDYDRPYLTTRRQRRRRDPDGDAEEGEGL